MKKYLTKLALIAVVGIAGAGFAGADVWDKKTIITTDEAMQLPNTILQPGTYVIKLAGTNTAERHVVQIFDKDEKHIITTILAIPNQRLQPTGKSVFAFWEVPAGHPKALRAWFYPGDNFGQEFAYPKAEADQITASNSGATVPVSEEKPDDLAAATTTAAAEPAPAPLPAPATATAEPAPAPVEVAAAPQQEAPPAPAVTQQPAPVVKNNSQDDAQSVAAQTPPPQTLPQTASNLPFLGLMGLLSLSGALTLKLAYNRG
jgi:hypothetical protein